MLDALDELLRDVCGNGAVVVGHSLGAQLAFALFCLHGEYIKKAVFFSAWLCPTQKSINNYLKIVPMSCKLLNQKSLVAMQTKYWQYNDKQSTFMQEYCTKIIEEQYAAFFIHTLQIDNFPEYKRVNNPMLAIAGKRETGEMKQSLFELGRRNINCKTMLLRGAAYDYPLRQYDKLNPILLDFIIQDRS